MFRIIYELRSLFLFWFYGCNFFNFIQKNTDTDIINYPNVKNKKNKNATTYT